MTTLVIGPPHPGAAGWKLWKVYGNVRHTFLEPL